MFYNYISRITVVPLSHFGVSVPNQKRYIPSLRPKYHPPEWLPKVQHVVCI